MAEGNHCGPPSDSAFTSAVIQSMNITVQDSSPVISCRLFTNVVRSDRESFFHFSCDSVNEHYMMVEYTFEEYTKMLIIYGEAGRNGRAEQRMYHERFLHRPTPSHRLPFW